MKNLLCSLLLIFITATSAHAGEMVLKGTFQGENLYVRNPFAASGVGFCIYEVTVNGMTTTDEINSSAFEIDLSVYNFVFGDHVTVNILYKEECSPKVLNPEVLNPRIAAQIDAVTVKDDQITFSTSGESGSLPFVIEQFRWNKWIKVAELDGNGKNKNNQYSAKIRLHSGSPICCYAPIPLYTDLLQNYFRLEHKGRPSGNHLLQVIIYLSMAQQRLNS